MKHTYYTADVFTNTVFQGAQIAVFPEAEKLAESLLPLIATELNLSDTVFVTPSNKSGEFSLRIFTPKGEIDFAGHAILATARALLEAGKFSLTNDNASLTFKQNNGEINVNVTQQDNKPVFVQFSLSANPVIDRYTPTEIELARLLCIDEKDIDTHLFKTRLASVNSPYLIVPLSSQKAVRKARFSLDAWSQSSAPAMAAQELFIFSNKTDNRDTDFHGRLLGPGIAVNEDPPIGSAMPCFIGYLSDHKHIREGTHTFTIDRGTSATRRSVLHIEMDYHTGKPATLRVGGEVVLVSENTFLLASS